MTDIFAGLDSDLNDINDDLSAEHAAEHGDMRGQLTDAAAVLRFVCAGKATITLRSRKTDVRFTYRITQSEDGLAYFVGVLTGSDNESDYSYLGRISRDIFWLGRKTPRPGDITKDAPSAKAFDWTWRKLIKDEMPDQLEVWHEGRCGRCGRKLTVPKSIATGFGPECAGKS